MGTAHYLLSGRVMTAIILAALVLMVCAAAYLIFANAPAAEPLHFADEAEAVRALELRRLTVLLTMLLLAALLIMLFVLGAYLLIRVGRLVARTRSAVGGKPTEYVDVWSQYRLTEEQIAAATGEPHRPRYDNPTDEDDPEPPPSV